jgi:hypothetical protein
MRVPLSLFRRRVCRAPFIRTLHALAPSSTLQRVRLLSLLSVNVVPHVRRMDMSVRTSMTLVRCGPQRVQAMPVSAGHRSQQRPRVQANSGGAVYVYRGTLLFDGVAISDTRAVRSGRVAGCGGGWVGVRSVSAAAQCTWPVGPSRSEGAARSRTPQRCAQTHARVHAHVHANTQVHARGHLRKQSHVQDTRTNKHTNRHTHTQNHTHTDTPSHT